MKMTLRDDLTTEELAALIAANINVIRAISDRIQLLLRQRLGEVSRVSDTEYEKAYLEMQRLLTDKISELTAISLKRDQRNTPLVSSLDLVHFLFPAFNRALHDFGWEEMDLQERAIIQNCIPQETQEMLLSSEETYKETWQRIGIMHELATKSGTSPQELFLSNEVLDEFIRMSYTKREFVDSFNQEESLTERLFLTQGELDSYWDAGGNEERRRQLKEEFVSKTMPLLQEGLEKIRRVMQEIAIEEADRIFDQE